MAKGEKDAERLYRSHGRRLLDFALRRTRDEHAAEDVVQETLGVAIEKGAPPDREGPWLFRVAKNKLMKLAERRARRREEPLTEPARSDEPSDELSLAEERARVGRALSMLEADLAEVIKLTYEDQLTHVEIAAKLGVPATTVQSRLRSALRRLHRELIEKTGEAAS